MKPIRPDYPSLVKEVRRQLAISQEDLARELDASYATVKRWKDGLSKPPKLPRAQLDKFCERTKQEALAFLVLLPH